MAEHAALFEDEVRDLVRRRGLDPQRDEAAFRLLVSEALADYEERALAGRVPPLLDAPRSVKRAIDSVAGLGPLQAFLEDDAIEEIWINGPGLIG